MGVSPSHRAYGALIHTVWRFACEIAFRLPLRMPREEQTLEMHLLELERCIPESLVLQPQVPFHGLRPVDMSWEG